MAKARTSKVVDATSELERRRVLEYARAERDRIRVGLKAMATGAEESAERARRLREGEPNELAAVRAGKALAELENFVEGFGRSLDEKALQALDVAVSCLEDGKPLPKGQFYDTLRSDAVGKPR